MHKFRKLRNNFYFLFEIFQLALFSIDAKLSQKNVVIDDVVDFKELKKIFRTKNNVLILFTSNAKETQNSVKVFNEAANLVKGQATAILLDCTNR